MRSKSLMIQGTASSSGKSLIAAALCRIFRQDGYRVAPFKAQNMSNNSFVTRDGLEMGRAQVVQAYAAGLEPDVRMNPVLLKPSSDTGSQVVLKGKPAFTMKARQWHETRDKLRCTIRDCYESLAAEYDLIVIEGAGSPAEINLKKNDIVNMGMAEMADAPVLLVGDIDRGGVFASLVGTMELLENQEKARVKAFVINKFRGDVGLLKPGLEQLEKICGVPVLGVVSWVHHAIDEEDGVTERFNRTSWPNTDIDICVIRLPRISNYTDFLPLEAIPGVRVRWCESSAAIGRPDLLILPGTKSTIGDLQVLKKSGFADAILSYAQRGGAVLGICGGFQMLGKEIHDPNHCESSCDKESGLGLLDMLTEFHTDKTTTQTQVTISSAAAGLFAALNGIQTTGFEIHMGKSDFGPDSQPFTVLSDASGREAVIGIASPSGSIAGTYLHGLFDSSIVATTLVNALRERKGLAQLQDAVVERSVALNEDIDNLADVVRHSLDMDMLKRIVEGKHVAA
ncbi:MAG: cobyric acid synthase [Chitinivibrionales bacterium]|nr:cobyric acid synthase [Chitinivibrionales bacterium]